MSDTVNDRDRLLESNGEVIGTTNTAVLVTPSSNAVRFSSGIYTPSSVTFTAVQVGISGSVVWSITGGELTGSDNNVKILDTASITSDTVSVTAKVFYGGIEHVGTCTVQRVRDGASGQTTYTWIKYADSVTGTGITDDPTGKAYIGFAYNKTVATESNTPSDYTWSLIKGTDGQPGPAGTSYFTWIKYSDVADGTGLYDVPTNNTMYIGIAVNKTTATESTNKADYVWSRFKGGDGVPGTSGESATIGYTLIDGNTLNNTPTSITTSGKTLPAVGSWGSTRAWTSLPSTSVAAGQAVFQSNGIYNPVTNQTVWGVPYLSNLKVGTLEAITANTGNLNVSGTISSANGKFVVDSQGNAEMRSVTIKDGQGNTILQAGTKLPIAYAPTGTVNADLVPSINSAATTSTWVGVNGRPSDPEILNSSFTNGTLTIGGDNLTNNSSFEKTVGGMAVGFDLYSHNASTEPTISYGTDGRLGGRAQLVEWSNNHFGTKGLSGKFCSNKWQPGRTYIISVWAKTTNLSTVGGLFLAWNVNPASTVVLMNPNISPTWQRYVFKITWGASVESNGDGYISLHYGSGGGNVIFDDMMVVEGDVLPAYSPSTIEAQNAADAANAAIPDIYTNIADKLSKTTASSLAATVTLASGGSILSGTTTNGTYQSPSGFYGVQNGVVKFAVPISGDPTFAGQLTAAYGTFGGLRIASGGYIAQGVYTGPWSWPASFEGGGFLIHPNGILMGNANNPNMGFIYMDAANGRLAMPGFDYSGRQLTLTNPILIDPQLNSYSVSVVSTTGNYYYTASRNNNGAFAGAYVATASGQTGAETYNWRVETYSGTARAWLSSTTTKQVELYVYGNGFTGVVDFQLICTVSRNGISVTQIVATEVEFF